MMEALKMETPMIEWNNDRLDELNERMKEGFAEVDERFVRLEGDMQAGFAKVDERFDKLNERFDRIYYLIVMTMVSLVGGLLASNVWG
jgi:tetrahydromethanopterin S-methyltransferase subunit G